MSGMTWLRLLAAVGLVAGAAGPALAEEQPEPGGETVIRAPQDRAALDASITNDIKAKLEAEWMLRHADVIISTQNGVVTLVGMVDTPFARDRAVNVAEKSAGVARVNNMLRLNVASPHAPSQN